VSLSIPPSEIKSFATRARTVGLSQGSTPRSTPSVKFRTLSASAEREPGADMELAFGTEKLRTLCVDHARAAEVYGEAAAEALRTRLADLRAVTYLSELPVGTPEVVEGDPPHLRFRLADGWTLLARVSHRNTPRTGEGTLDLSRVRRAQVVEIER
jgi:hypothetical protein